MKHLNISVPASSANLGPGFDCVGLALDIRNEFAFQYPTENYQINAKGFDNSDIYRPEKNLIIQSYIKTVSAHGIQPIKFHLDCTNRIPFESGMGSSASAIAAGVAAARSIHGLDFKPRALLKDALLVEAHPDNLSACIYGGLTITYINNDGKPVVYHIKPDHFPACYVIHPHKTVNTAESRKALRLEIPLNLVIENMARSIITVSAFTQGKYEYLYDSLKDYIHEPFRMNPIMEYPKLKEKFKNAGFYGWAISGSGPSVIMFCENITDKICDYVRQHFEERNVTYDEFFPNIDYRGLVVA